MFNWQVKIRNLLCCEEWVQNYGKKIACLNLMVSLLLLLNWFWHIHLFFFYYFVSELSFDCLCVCFYLKFEILVVKGSEYYFSMVLHKLFILFLFVRDDLWGCHQIRVTISIWIIKVNMVAWKVVVALQSYKKTIHHIFTENSWQCWNRSEIVSYVCSTIVPL